MSEPSFFDIDDREIRAALRQLVESVNNPRPALLAIGETLQESTTKRFSTKTAPDGTAWDRNSEVTMWTPKKLPTGGYEIKGRDDPLVDHNTLGTTIGYQLLGDDGLVIGSPMEYAAMMQFGGSPDEFPNLWGEIPGRPFLGISDEDKVEVMRILQSHLHL